MRQQTHFNNPVLPYLLIAPQITITILFFFWPASEAVKQAFLVSDPFGNSSTFVWFENFTYIFASPEYIESIVLTIIFSTLTAIFSLSIGLLFAVLTDRILKMKLGVQTLLIWPYAVAPAMAGILWQFIFHPSYGVIGLFLKNSLKLEWNPILNGNHALTLIILASSWKQISYNFVFFLSGLQSIQRPIQEAACIDGAGPIKRFFYITLPLLTPTIFFLSLMNLVYAFFETFGVIHTTTQGGPGGATNTLVYKVYSDGFVGLDLGGSAAQSVILMVIVMLLTCLQFKFLEKKVQY